MLYHQPEMSPQLSCNANSLVICTLAEELYNLLSAGIDPRPSLKGPLVLEEQPVQKSLPPPLQ